MHGVDPAAGQIGQGGEVFGGDQHCGERPGKATLSRKSASELVTAAANRLIKKLREIPKGRSVAPRPSNSSLPRRI
jgi:hypothetical protein